MSDLIGNPEDRFSHNEAHMSCIIKDLSLGFLTRSNTDLTVQPQNKARGLKFLIDEEEEFHNLCGKSNEADPLQLNSAFVFRYAKCRFSRDAANILSWYC